jgi:hypothetical protein
VQYASCCGHFAAHASLSLEKAAEDARTHIFIHKYLLCMPTSTPASS